MSTRIAAAVVALTLVAAAQTQAPPRLLVVIVVDQMRADYIERFRANWTSGFRRLLQGGARFTEAAYPYTTTLTCAGHATIGTGAYPHRHGVHQNTWWSRERAQIVPCTDDPSVESVAYGRTSRGRHSAAALRVPTLADEMRASGAKVVTLSLKARSAIMLAGHGGTAVTWLSETFDGWETSTAYASAPVPEVQAFVKANPIEADYGRTWTRLLPAAAYTEADAGEGETPPAGWQATFPHVLRGDANDVKPDEEFYLQWERSPFADAYLGRMAAALASAFALGKTADRTDYLAVSFSTPDLVGHKFGPDSQEVRDIYANLDRTLGTLLDALDRQVGTGQYVLALTADHGVQAIPEQARRAGRDAGRLSSTAIRSAVQSAAESVLGRGDYVARVNTHDIYFQPGMYEIVAGSPEALKAVVRAVAEVPGVARVFTRAELEGGAGSADPLLRATALSYSPRISGDLMVAPRPGWMFTQDATTHGSATPDDQRVPLLLFGRGVKPGLYEEQASPADIAPTFGALVGITLKNAEGRILHEVLR